MINKVQKLARVQLAIQSLVMQRTDIDCVLRIQVASNSKWRQSYVFELSCETNETMRSMRGKKAIDEMLRMGMMCNF